ncbi:MAG: hypothetical protein NT178_04395 [Proteobacteria bacterium]|nr:hypothetical protein [Pseudomonadota bacterium]
MNRLSIENIKTFGQPQGDFYPTLAALSANVAEKLQIKNRLGFTKNFKVVENVSTGIAESSSLN